MSIWKNRCVDVGEWVQQTKQPLIPPQYFFLIAQNTWYLWHLLLFSLGSVLHHFKYSLFVFSSFEIKLSCACKSGAVSSDIVNRLHWDMPFLFFSLLKRTWRFAQEENAGEGGYFGWNSIFRHEGPSSPHPTLCNTLTLQHQAKLPVSKSSLRRMNEVPWQSRCRFCKFWSSWKYSTCYWFTGLTHLNVFSLCTLWHLGRLFDFIMNILPLKTKCQTSFREKGSFTFYWG